MKTPFWPTFYVEDWLKSVVSLGEFQTQFQLLNKSSLDESRRSMVDLQESESISFEIALVRCLSLLFFNTLWTGGDASNVGHKRHHFNKRRLPAYKTEQVLKV